ncbi:ABC transporter permease [Alicyclobacillus sp.]|uniref:ABC transporter permease n=1 Tax=Alicyclobacillus sp. TaxID=61169 RepID=UPI0025BBBC04|nr:ABC transporter permease [Alicyclobacillus sp.]MCL6517035.1 ABC transporter permease [Alicyclobacillus sp.]
MLSARNVLITVEKEFLETVRNRWLQGFVLVFLILSFTVAAIAHWRTDSFDFDTVHRIHVSLLNLCLLLIPLMALLLGSQNVVAERADGFFELMCTYPVSGFQLMFGKFLGAWAALGTGLLVGVGVTGLSLALFTQSIGAGVFLALLVTSTGLAGAFLAVGMVISSRSRSRGSALVTALVVWLLAVAVYDMVLVQAIVAWQGHVHPLAFRAALFANPVDVVRVLLTHWLGLGIDVGTNTGMLEVVTTPSTASLVVALVLWSVLPMLVCRYKLHSSARG